MVSQKAFDAIVATGMTGLLIVAIGFTNKYLMTLGLILSYAAVLAAWGAFFAEPTEDD